MDLTAALWGVGGISNFELHEAPGRTMLHRPETLAALTERFDTMPEALRGTRRELAEQLRKARALREPPLRDDKVLTDWNRASEARPTWPGRPAGQLEATE